MSAFLFNILAETITIELRSNLEDSFTVKNSKHNLNQYADDTGIYSFFTQKALDSIIFQLDRLETHTGLKVNYEKTAIYRMGSLKNSCAKLYTLKPLALESEGLNILGVYITHQDNLVEAKYQPTFEKAKAILTKWCNRRLSLMGKILIINTLVASLFVHKMLVLPNISKAYVQKLESEFIKFLWNSRKPKIAMSILQLKKDLGGA